MTGEVRREGVGGASSSARSLLFTVLGECLREPGREFWTSTLVLALQELGVEEAAARRAVARTASRDWMESVRVGRRSKWRLTPRAVDTFAETAHEVLEVRRHDRVWDGRWLVVFTSVPEVQRGLRHQLRTALRGLGLGPIHQGAWVTPDTSSDKRVRAALERLNLTANAVSFVGDLGSIGSEFQIVQEAWDLVELARGYGDFLTTFGEVAPKSQAEEFTQLMWLAHSWRGFFLTDPGLPSELLPGRWIGRQARTLFYDRHDAWLPGAQAWVDALDEAGDATR
jgi:phenylacetic acid degradation operon negative regulatory protein